MTSRALFLCAVAACASRQSPSDSFGEGERIDSPRPEIILRNTSWLDPELAARGLGRLEVTVRVADRPAQNIQQSTVSIRQADREVRRPMATDARGIARLDFRRSRAVPVDRQGNRVRRSARDGASIPGMPHRRGGVPRHFRDRHRAATTAAEHGTNYHMS
jgi:hypothetical protein